MLATRQGNLKIVKILLDHGADPNAQNSVSFLILFSDKITSLLLIIVHL